MRAAGYPGGYTQVKAYVRQVRPRRLVAPVVRFETPPGYQGQVDFGTFALPWCRRHALPIVLGYSRLSWVPQRITDAMVGRLMTHTPETVKSPCPHLPISLANLADLDPAAEIPDC